MIASCPVIHRRRSATCVRSSYRPILDADARGRMLEAAEWMLRNFGGRQQALDSPLILPCAQFCTFADVTGHARAERIYMQVKELAGMAEWPCVLEEQPEPLRFRFTASRSRQR